MPSANLAIMMGPVFHHRLPALAAALLSSIALALLAAAGTTCNFLTISASNGQSLETDVDGQDDASVTSLDIGVLCGSEYFQSDGDTFWLVSRAFFIVSLVLASLCTILAWALSTFLPPNDTNWKILSVGTALTAVFQVPIFLLFEADPCSDHEEHNCTVSLGVFLLIGSTILWVADTVLTQCLDPPRWSVELDAWKVQKRREALNAQQDDAFIISEQDDDDGMEELLIMQQYSNRGKKSASSVLDTTRRWFHKRRWANSPDLPVAATESASHDEDVRAVGNSGAEYPEVGSYYANSNNSRLVLKVTADGKRIGDDQRSVTTFGDLADFAPSSLNEHDIVDELDIENDSKLLGEELLSNDNDRFVGDQGFGVASGEPAGQLTKTERAVRSDEENPPPAVFADEPMIYTDPKAFSRSVLSDDGFESDGQENPKEKKIISGIRALTIRMKRDVSRRMRNENAYAVMDDESRRSQSTLTRETKDGGQESKSNSRETGGSSSPDDRPRSCMNGKLLKDWKTLFADGATPDMMVANSTHSSSEDDPEAVNYSSEDTQTSFSMLSFGAQSRNDEDDSSSLSSATMSDTSDSEVEIDFALRSRQRRDRQRIRRIRRTRSAGNSVASRTSLLDTTIDEETDFDLKEFESSGDEHGIETDDGSRFSLGIVENSRPLTRTKSAPDVGAFHSDVSSALMHGFDSRSLSGYERRILHKRRLSQQVVSSMSSAESEVQEIVSDTDETTSTSMSGYEGRILHKRRLREHVVSTPSSYGSEGQQVISVTDESTASGGDISIDNINLEGYNASTDDDNDDPSVPNRRRCRSLSVRRRRSRSTFRYDRLYRDGIHSPLIGVVTDDDSSQKHSLSETSTESHAARSTISRRARRARVRRLQVETEEKLNHRRRARTLDPPKNRWRTPSPDGLDPSRISVRVAPLTVEEYGPDEASL